MNEKPYLYRWRDAVRSPSGDLKPRTRHILMDLSFYMDSKGTGAFPTHKTISYRTGWSKATVCRALGEAETAGWLLRIPGRTGRATWYAARFPAPQTRMSESQRETPLNNYSAPEGARAESGASRALPLDDCGDCGERRPLVDDIYCQDCADKRRER